MTSTAPIRISDTTLRDGEQAPGIAWTCSQKWHLLKQLIEIGVDDVEVGMAAHLDAEREFFRRAAASNFRHRLSIFCRADSRDIQLAEAIGVGCIHISIPTSPIQLQGLGVSTEEVVLRAEAAVTMARSICGNVSLGLQDATRTGTDFLRFLSAWAKDHGVTRLRLSDTVGIASPTQVRRIVREVADRYDGLIEFHGHNDLGLAVANSLGAIEGGARSVSVTVGGIGERAGNAPLEQVVTAIQFALGLSHHIHPEALIPLCQLVASMSGESIAPRSPVVGKSIFTMESGMHCLGATRDALMFQPFTPKMIGRSDPMAYAVGKHAGAATVQSVLGGLSIPVSIEKAREIAASARRIASHRGAALTVDEVISMACETAPI